MTAGCGFSTGFNSGFDNCRPRTVAVEGVRPFEEIIDADPMLIVRAHAGPLRELFAARDRYDKRERE